MAIVWHAKRFFCVRRCEKKIEPIFIEGLVVYNMKSLLWYKCALVGYNRKVLGHFEIWNLLWISRHLKQFKIFWE